MSDMTAEDRAREIMHSFDRPAEAIKQIRQAEAAARKAALEEKVARYADDLAKIYVKHPLAVAKVCDKCLDRSGGLLGIVRDKAIAIRALAESEGR